MTFACFVENPPVAVVENEWQMLSKTSIPAKHSSTVSAIVMPEYINQIHLAVTPMRGWTLSFVMPVASAANSCIPPVPNIGSTAMVKKTIPKPPIHCVKLRQNSSECGKLSRLSMTVKPVVVKPDIVSKKQSVMVGM